VGHLNSYPYPTPEQINHDDPKSFSDAELAAQCFGQRWDVPAYSTAELGELAVRYLLRRGHEVPDDVRSAVLELAAQLPERTVQAAHGRSAGLARTAASRTLTVADLGYARPGPSSARLEGGLASVG
jgi:hypothetical protein